MTTQEQIDTAREEAYEQNKVYCQKVVDELIALGHDAQVKKPNSGEMPSISIDGDTYMVKMRTYYAGGSMSAQASHLKFVVDHYGASVNFRQKKDGTFNYKNIAKKATEKIEIANECAKADLRKQAIVAASKAIVARLEERYGVFLYKGAPCKNILKINVDFSQFYKDIVTLSIPKGLTEDQAAQVIELVQSFSKED